MNLKRDSFVLAFLPDVYFGSFRALRPKNAKKQDVSILLFCYESLGRTASLQPPSLCLMNDFYVAEIKFVILKFRKSSIFLQKK